ncbi:unnamed protein product [Brachionus calyciflorus]|uniref:Uncharacterized protein n=1 Tax=Brachionus calyciflorus TaxID=104777 RepID=A0A814GS63_9BILA|nr:unnamed protein product [Brachionus calyciflorus]
MSSFINKLASSLTDKTSGLVGRDNLAKITKVINKGISASSKYRDFMKAGNVVQFISQSSKMTLQICQSQNDPNRLILLGNGQIGPEYPATHFLIEADPSTKHLKFSNANNYICYDNEIPCILREGNDKFTAIRSRNEFRLHEIIGSDEFFALESVYFPGRYLAVLPDGSITSVKNRADTTSHFCINVIHSSTPMPREKTFSVNVNVNTGPPVIGVRESAGPASSLSRQGSNISSKSGYQSKEQESNFYMNQNQSSPRQPPPIPPRPQIETPPQYTNLFPKLPPS